MSILTEFGVVAFEMADLGATEDSEVLKLGSADSGAVRGDEEELGLSGSDGAEGVLVTYSQSS